MKWILIVGMMLITSEVQAQNSKRSTVLNFEDEMVEGINRKPLDSVNQISERNKKGKSHLYKKRAGFADRDQILMNELRLQP
ncbi:MAG: hypothetical protein JST80_00215 [Bdellovibrionales bacterium]|nr:hypothetical protein [Bdellovibrionales bacterium]